MAQLVVCRNCLFKRFKKDFSSLVYIAYMWALANSRLKNVDNSGSGIAYVFCHRPPPVRINWPTKISSHFSFPMSTGNSSPFGKYNTPCGEVRSTKPLGGSTMYKLQSTKTERVSVNEIGPARHRRDEAYYRPSVARAGGGQSMGGEAIWLFNFAISIFYFRNFVLCVRRGTVSAPVQKPSPFSRKPLKTASRLCTILPATRGRVHATDKKTYPFCKTLLFPRGHSYRTNAHWLFLPHNLSISQGAGSRTSCLRCWCCDIHRRDF